MIKKHSFYIQDSNLDELEKQKIRQDLICEFTKKPASDFADLFTVALPVELAGSKNCENLCGSIEVPVGVAGPVTATVNAIKKSFLIPLATTEGALVASIHRGLKVLNTSETTVVVKKVGMSRSVVFECASITDALAFSEYFAQNSSIFAGFCEETSKHLQFLSFDCFMRDKLLYYRFVFDTDEAMGMNMVTIALSYAWDQFKQQLPKDIVVTLLTVSGNVCTDKKDSMINRLFGRGYFVTVESKIALSDVARILKVSAKELVKIHLVKNVIGSNIAGSFAQNMHVANALAAFYLATGQDIAHVVAGSEASVHFEIVSEKAVSGAVKGEEIEKLYVALTLPNVSVGSVGGGTWLPKQKQARSILLENQQPKALDLAAGVGLAALAGEISGLAALTTHTLAAAHQKLGRTQ